MDHDDELMTAYDELMAACHEMANMGEKFLQTAQRLRKALATRCSKDKLAKMDTLLGDLIETVVMFRHHLGVPDD